MDTIAYFLSLMLIVSVMDFKSNSELVREKRGIPVLTFPRTSPTRMQIISGIGIPVALDFESVTIGFVFKAEYFLPENASNVLDILADPFSPTTRPITGTGRKRRSENEPTVLDPVTDDYYTRGASRGFDDLQQQKFERYSVPAMVMESGANPVHVDDDLEDEEEYDEDYGPIPMEDDIEQDAKQYRLDDTKVKQPNNLATARFTLYKGLESMVSRNGLQGRPCMLRSICESAAAQFTYNNGILGELAHIVMTPSTSPDQVIQHSDNEYLHAEVLGRSGAPCEKVFHECPISILDKFSGMYNSVGGLMNYLG